MRSTRIRAEIMNYQRRKRLTEVVNQLTEIMDELENISNEEQEALDNLPENLMYSNRADEMNDNVIDIDSAKDDISDIIDTITEIIEK